LPGQKSCRKNRHHAKQAERLHNLLRLLKYWQLASQPSNQLRINGCAPMASTVDLSNWIALYQNGVVRQASFALHSQHCANYYSPLFQYLADFERTFLSSLSYICRPEREVTKWEGLLSSGRRMSAMDIWAVSGRRILTVRVSLTVAFTAETLTRAFTAVSEAVEI
jgi:hypothetical protein